MSYWHQKIPKFLIPVFLSIAKAKNAVKLGEILRKRTKEGGKGGKGGEGGGGMAGVGRMELEETAADAVKEEEEAKNKSDFQKKNMR